MEVTMDVSHVSATASQLTVTLTYTGMQSLVGQNIIVTIPKAFASSSSSITVDAGGADVTVVQSDPVFAIHFDKMATGAEKVVRFVTNSTVNRGAVRSGLTNPILLTEGYASGQATPTPTTKPSVTPMPGATPTPIASVTPSVVPEQAGFDIGMFSVVVVVLLPEKSLLILYWLRKEI